MSATLTLTQELIARPSVTPADGGCQELLAQRLNSRAGFQVERLRYGNVDNLWARRGRGGPVLCFAGHTDVVPTGPLEEWRSDPFKPTIRDGLLYGRGAADMKSGLAAMVTATEEFVPRTPRISGSAGLSDHQRRGRPLGRRHPARRGDAARRAASTSTGASSASPPASSSIGDTIKIGRRGSLSGRLTVHGVQGHIAYPQFADNPVHRFAPALAELASRVWDQGNEHFQPTSFQVSNLNAGTGAPNVIPGELKARFNLRYSPVQTLDELKRTVEEILQRHQVRLFARVVRVRRALLHPAGSAVGGRAAPRSAAVTRLTPRSSRPAGGTSDGRFIAPLGAQVVELGVVNASIHKVNECVRVEDIDTLHAMYLQRCATCWPDARNAGRMRSADAATELATSPQRQHDAAISTQAGIVSPRKRQVTRAHSPEPVSTFRITVPSAEDLPACKRARRRRPAPCLRAGAGSRRDAPATPIGQRSAASNSSTP